MTDANRAIIVGGGHNGLVCATYLARSGWNITVLEASDRLGGAATTREFAPGYSVSSCAHFVYQLQPEVASELNLKKHGLAFAAEDLSTIALSTDGNHLTLQGGKLTGAAGDTDKDALRDFHAMTTQFAGLIQRYLNRPPPRLVERERDDTRTLARLGFDLKRLGRERMREFLRVIAINIHDLLGEHFDSEQVMGALCLDAVLGTHLGPRSPNSVLTYLHRLAGGGAARGIAQPLGGMGSVSEALARAARSAGVTLRTGAKVRQILVDHGRATGVELDDGETVAAPIVISNADPKSTVLGLVGARHFDTGFVRRIGHVRMRGNAAKLHLALDGLPAIDGLEPGDYGQRMVIAPDRHYVERAFNPAKYGECSPNPVMEISIPTVRDPALAPTGHHVLSAVLQYAPYALSGGWDAAARERLYELAVDTLGAYAPTLREHIVDADVASPADIEERFLIEGGHWHHGELALDQFLFARPVPGAAQYRLPLSGLYLCGAGAHPGGGVSGAAGRNAAREILKEDGRP